ncbi:ABC-F family ATP-binding cassette domain-containing protein [Flavobacterium reichenbachii]|uniref:ABC transporter ATP-binding protein n=1 Tax=Flavobacterium reichenbachii TaxID=362418 RepID=A0A085ZF38_9FLAO|nr:ABC-F family ATP-binding cassette domain-containing protein [Flavobacterium reichenbachii]KFF03052.1 ABC transporter ATP-binding protein [Flavobacterium reichenbachii]OXB17197.1 ABC transporter ATP-binding protein [Flavobacterium reichenbachii]
MLNLQDITYMHPNREMLFSGITFTINKKDKIALTGNNGAGKFTLLQLMAYKASPSAGTIRTSALPYYVPQLTNYYNSFSTAQVLGIEEKIKALRKITAGNGDLNDYVILDDDWSIEERFKDAFAYWKLDEVSPEQVMETLSGGQKTKVFLAGIQIHQPEIILLDEPSNHLDSESRKLLYEYILNSKSTIVVVSHDRTLLNLLPVVCELNAKGITTYGGNYEFYVQQKQIESNALSQDLQNKEKELRKARETERQSVERQNKLDARGKKKQEKAGLPTIAMKTLKNKAEKSTSKLKGVHFEKIESISNSLSQLRSEIPDGDQIKLDLDDSALHKGRELITANAINFSYGPGNLWKIPIGFQINSGERIAVKGKNGKGKTTLIKMILGKLQPNSGFISLLNGTAIYIDQDYSLINDSLNIYEQAQQYNTKLLQEHEVKLRLNRFLFSREDWDKSCRSLSGGEKMRLILCCLTIGNQAPDLIILDEPTNNLDLQNIGILTSALKEYKGTLLVISHDDYFLNEINITQDIIL